MLWYPEEGWLCRLSKTDFQRKGPEVAFWDGCVCEKGTGTEESKLVEKAFGCSTDVLGSGGSWHKPYWGPGCVQDSACCLG